MGKLNLPEGQDNVIVRNQEVYGFLPKDVIDRVGDTSTQLATEDQTALGAINELKTDVDESEYFQDGETYEISGEVHLFTFSGGRSEKVNIFTPKKIKTGYTVTVAGTIKAIYTNTTSITSDITLSGDCTVRGDNSVVISVSHSTAMSTNLVSVVPNSLLFTFHAPV